MQSPAICPAGFSCSCGRNYEPCSAASSYCLANSAAPAPVAPGYMPVARPSPFAADGGLLVNVAQTRCPIGSFCVAGVRTPCFPGTYGAYSTQTSSSGCIACGSGTFLAAIGAGSSAFQTASPCVPCPARASAEDSGAFFCAWWSPNSRTSPLPGGACAADETAFAGPFGGCLALPEHSAAAVTGSSVFLTLPPSTFPGDLGDSWAAQVRNAVTVALVLGIPCMLGAVAFVALRLGLVKPESVLLQGLVWPLLRALDQIGDWQLGAVAHGQPLHWQGGEVGGCVSQASVSGIFAMVTMLLVAFFGPENIVVSQFVLPARAEYLEDYEGAPFFALPAPVPAAPMLSQGLLVQAALQGPDCATAAVADPLLDEGAFEHTVETSGIVSVHSFSCTECFFGDLSQLTVSFSPTCQSVALLVSAVSARGGVTAASFVAEPPAGAFLERFEVAVSPMMDVVMDRSLLPNGVSRAPPAPPSLASRSRGLLFSAQEAPLVMAPAPPGAVTLLVELVPAATFTGLTYNQKFFYIDLVYQLLATLALGAFGTFTFLFLFERLKRFELLEFMKAHGHLPHKHVPRLAYFMMPGEPFTDGVRAPQALRRSPSGRELREPNPLPHGFPHPAIAVGDDFPQQMAASSGDLAGTGEESSGSGGGGGSGGGSIGGGGGGIGSASAGSLVAWAGSGFRSSRRVAQAPVAGSSEEAAPAGGAVAHPVTRLAPAGAGGSLLTLRTPRGGQSGGGQPPSPLVTVLDATPTV